MTQNHITTDSLPALSAFPAAKLRLRIDGWTPEKQRLFCETLADCGLVREAAAIVGMTRQSAYRLRRRAEGRSFALAWDAALYLARAALIDEALERAVDGNVDVFTKDGVIVGERRRKDSHVLLTAISKLDSTLFANRTTQEIAQEFDAFLDCMEADGNHDQAGNVDEHRPSGGHTGQFLMGRRQDDSQARKQINAARSRLNRADDYCQEIMETGQISLPRRRPNPFEKRV
jgi:hypothetical protein